ncbi:MAG: creatininase family protein, partial [Chloroflexota bacterium]
RRFLILNGHGGNDGVRGRLYELANELSGSQFSWYAWWQSHSVISLAEEFGVKPAHANWLEAFQFTRVSELPDGEKAPPRVQGLLGAEQARLIFGDGVFGGPYQVDLSLMDQIFNAALEDVLQLLRFE